MTIVDLTGKAITELVTNVAVTAIVGQKVRPEFAAGESPPAVIVESLGIDYSPLGQTRRARIQAPTFAAKCFGGTRVQASQLANAVVEAIELRGPRKDASGRQVFISLVESGGDVVLDPVTKWPFATVIFRLIGAQQAVA
jgi:hypothetical protein